MWTTARLAHLCAAHDVFLGSDRSSTRTGDGRFPKDK
jgi:hypothetical protein